MLWWKQSLTCLVHPNSRPGHRLRTQARRMSLIDRLLHLSLRSPVHRAVYRWKGKEMNSSVYLPWWFCYLIQEKTFRLVTSCEKWPFKMRNIQNVLDERSLTYMFSIIASTHTYFLNRRFARSTKTHYQYFRFFLVLIFARIRWSNLFTNWIAVKREHIIHLIIVVVVIQKLI